jgi:hypothetical protein
MTDETMWYLLLCVLTFLGTRLVKRWPRMPKDLLPGAALALGCLLYLGKLLLIDSASLTEAVDVVWLALGPGVVAIGGHEVLKRSLLSLKIPRYAVTWLLGRVPTPGEGDLPPPKLKPPVEVIFVALLPLTLLGCLPSMGVRSPAVQAQAEVANGIAVTVNAKIPQLLELREQEGLAAIENAPDRPAAKAALAKVRQRWASVVAAIKVFAAAHDAWATALESGGTVDLESVLQAYCELRTAAIPWTELPALPGAACEEKP